MKKLKTKNIYKAKNVMFDADKLSATSYDWWQFVRKIRGQVVFNDYPYSSTTKRHQYKVQTLLNELGIEVDHYVRTRKSLAAFDTIKQAKIATLKQDIADCEAKLEKLGAQ